MKKFLETTVIVFAMMCFWGMIYPDLCFTEDICVPVTDVVLQEEGSWTGTGDDRDLFREAGIRDQRPGVLEAGRKIRVKSRLAEWLAGEQEEGCGKEGR